MNVVETRPPLDETLALLDEAYDGWGEAENFEWLCDQPDPVTHWYVEDDGDVVGYEMGVGRELRGRDGSSYTAVLRGHAAVAQTHRGQGVWSSLVDSIDRHIEREGVGLSMKYMDKEFKTFDVAMRDGYAWRYLPVYINILSPKRVVEHRAGDVLQTDDALERLTSTVLDTVDIELSDGRLDANALLGRSSDGGTDEGGVVSFSLSDEVVTALVEVLCSDPSSPTDLLGEAAQTLGARTSVPFGGDDAATPSPTPATTVTQRAMVSEGGVDRLCRLYAEVNAEYDYYFRRERDDIRHMLDHPDLLTTVWATRGDELVGFAALQSEPNSKLDQIWVLDAVARDESAHRALLDEIESVGVENDADVVAMLSNRSPGTDWARIKRQVMVWNPFGAPSHLRNYLETADWRVGLYDVE
jgi:hypothetical protein